MKIAIIGSGGAGMMAAWGLKTNHEITVYEKAPVIGGHVSSLTTDCFDNNFTVDNGFIVFNFESYPILAAVLERLGLKASRAKMSVAISGGNTFTICEDLYQVLLANKAWLLDPRALLLLVNIIRFHLIARRDLKNDNIPDVTIFDYLKMRRINRRLYDNFLGPVAAAIWVGSPKSMAKVPARSLIKFFEHHNMLGFRKYKWFTVKGGAIQYIKALAAELDNSPQTNCAVTRVLRTKKGVEIEDSNGGKRVFDQVVFTCPPDVALKILGDPSSDESETLSAFDFQRSNSYCHRDTSLMPDRKGTWMSWNCHYHRNEVTGEQDMTVSYYQNALKKMDHTNPLFLSIAPPSPPNPDLVLKQYDWSHTQFDRASIAAQKKITQIQGHNKTWYAGAWMGYGFHEDALGSGLAVARALGCEHDELPRWSQPDW